MTVTNSLHDKSTMSTIINNVNNDQQCQQWSTMSKMITKMITVTSPREFLTTQAYVPKSFCLTVSIVSTCMCNFLIFLNFKTCFSFLSMLLLVNPPKKLKLFLQAFTMRWVYAFSLMSTLRTLPPGFTGRSSPETFILWVLSTKVTTL